MATNDTAKAKIGDASDDSNATEKTGKNKRQKKRSVTRFFLKFFGWIIGIVLILVVALLLIAEFAHDKVIKLALPSVQEIINAPVNIGQTSLSFIRAFPYATLELDGVYLGSVFKTNTKADSLVFVEKVYVSLKTEPLKNGKIEITEIEFKGAIIKYLIDTAGVASYDFLISTDTTPHISDPAPLGLVIDLEKLTISDITFIYDDRKLGAHAKAYIPKITANGALSDSLIQAQIKGSVQVTEVDLDSTNLNQLKLAELKLDVDYVGENITINDVTLTLDDIIIAISGSAKIADSVYTDLHATCSGINFADVVKFAPDGILDEVGVKRVEGKLNFSADIKGNITDTTHYPHIEANIDLKKGLVETAEYPLVKNIKLNVDATTGNLDTDESISLTINNFHFETPQSSGTIKLTGCNINRPHYNVDGLFHASMSEVAPFIPADLGISQIAGSADLSLKSKGFYAGSVNDAFIDRILRNTLASLKLNQLCVAMDSVITIDNLNLNLDYANYGVNIKNTNVNLPDYDLQLKNIGLAAKVSNGISDFSKTKIDLNKLHAEVEDSKIDLTANVSNLNQPNYQATLGLDVNIGNFQHFLPDSLAHSISGGFAVDVKSHGIVNPDSIKSQIFDIVINNTEAGIQFNNISADMYNSYISFNNLAGNINIANDSICVDKVNIDWQGLKLHLDSTLVQNALKIFLLDQTDNKLQVLTKTSLDEFDYAWLDRLIPPTNSTTNDSIAIADMPITDSIPIADSIVDVDNSDEPYSFLSLGYPVDIRGMVKLGHLQYQKASIDSIQAKFSLNDTVIVVEHMKLGAFKGDMDASARVKFKNAERMLVYFRANLNQMDLNQLLIDFDNFDQTMVTANNLSGQMSATLDGLAEVINMGDSIPLDKVKVLGNLKLENGEIKDLEMLKTLDKFVNMRELNDIRFQTLTTSLFVRNGSLFLPQTDIKTSAMNMSLFAMQGIDNNNFEYHIKIFPGEIMLGNSKSVMKKQSQMKDNLADESNMKSINLLAYDIDGDSKYWFDTETRKKKMRTKINIQQKQLELKFHPRLIKYDTGVKFQ